MVQFPVKGILSPQAASVPEASQNWPICRLLHGPRKHRRKCRYLLEVIGPKVATLLQDGPSYLCVVHIHLAAVGLKVDCNERQTTRGHVSQKVSFPSSRLLSPMWKTRMQFQN